MNCILLLKHVHFERETRLPPYHYNIYVLFIYMKTLTKFIKFVSLLYYYFYIAALEA